MPLDKQEDKNSGQLGLKSVSMGTVINRRKVG